MITADDHPAFERARGLSSRWRHRFATCAAEAAVWQRYTAITALATRVLAVATTRIECAWCAYIDAVPGHDHAQEAEHVLRYGTKLPEELARVIFPQWAELPYAH